jgi:hypothetical protein
VPAALQQLPNLKAVEYFNSGSWAHFDPDSPDSEAFAEAGHDPWVNPQH